MVCTSVYVPLFIFLKFEQKLGQDSIIALLSWLCLINHPELSPHNNAESSYD